MSWALQADGSWTKSGTTREALSFDDPFPASGTVKIQLASVGHEVRVMVHSHPDLRTGWEVGVVGATLLIRPVLRGVPDVPVDAQVHGISAGVPCELSVTLEEDRIIARLETTGQAAIESIYQNSTVPTYREFSDWGVVSDVDGARVLSIEVCERIPIISEVADVLLAFCQGAVLASYDGVSMVELARNAFSTETDVSSTIHNGLVYAVDGQRAKIIDVVNRTVSDWGPEAGGNWVALTTGFLPGATPAPTLGEYLPGTTTARVVATFNDRVVLAYGRNLILSAVGDPQLFFVGEGVPSGAYAPRPIADQIVSLSITAWDALLVGGLRSMHQLEGDPTRSLPVLRALPGVVGCSGLNAAGVGVGVATLFHSPHGLHLANPEGAPVPLSAPTVQTGMRIADQTQYWVTVARDPTLYMSFVFITPRASSLDGTHWAYSEDVGGYQPGRGGFFPVTFNHGGHQPTCAAWWRGRMVVGCRDGYLRRFDAETATDDGVAIDARLFAEMVNPDGVAGDSILRLLDLELADDSGPMRCVVYGAPTVQALYDPAKREVRADRVLYANLGRVIGSYRGGAVGVELRSTSGSKCRIEALEATGDVGARLRRGLALPLMGAQQACSVPGIETPTGGGGTGEGPGTGGSGGGGGTPTICKTPGYDVSMITPGAVTDDSGSCACSGTGCARFGLGVELASQLAAWGLPVPTLNCCSFLKAGWILYMERRMCFPGGAPETDPSWVEYSHSNGNFAFTTPTNPVHTTTDYVGTELADTGGDDIYEACTVDEMWGGSWVSSFADAITFGGLGTSGRTVDAFSAQVTCDVLEIRFAWHSESTGVSGSSMFRLRYISPEEGGYGRSGDCCGGGG